MGVSYNKEPTSKIVTISGKKNLYPKAQCNDCGENISPRWEKNGNLFWKHKNKGKCKSVYTGEIAINKFAVQCLIGYLNNGGKLEFRSKCRKCNNEIIQILPMSDRYHSNTLHYSLDGEKQIFDILGNKDGETTFGIKIFCPGESHLFLNAGIPWFSLDAIDTTQKLVTRIIGDIVTLNDMCPVLRCDAPYCISIRELAYRLGYTNIVSLYSCESRQIVDEADKGGYFSNDDWKLKGKDDVELWSVFISRGCCLRCENKDSTIKYKQPFCMSCYSYIVNDKRQDKIIWVESERQEELKIALSWLDQIPGDWKAGDSCYCCERNYTTEADNLKYKHLWELDKDYICSYVIWLEDRKRCCTICLDKILRKHKIVA